MQVSFEGVVTAYVYADSAGTAGRLLEKDYFDSLAAYDNGQGTPGEITEYTYDAYGRQTEVVQDRDDQRVTTNGYDGYGRLTSVASPEGTIHYEYDAVTGALLRTYTGSLDVTATPGTGDGEEVTDTRYEYDSLGRLAALVPLQVGDGVVRRRVAQGPR